MRKNSATPISMLFFLHRHPYQVLLFLLFSYQKLHTTNLQGHLVETYSLEPVYWKDESIMHKLFNNTWQLFPFDFYRIWCLQSSISIEGPCVKALCQELVSDADMKGATPPGSLQITIVYYINVPHLRNYAHFLKVAKGHNRTLFPRCDHQDLSTCGSCYALFVGHVLVSWALFVLIRKNLYIGKWYNL